MLQVATPSEFPVASSAQHATLAAQNLTQALPVETMLAEPINSTESSSLVSLN